MTQWHPLFAQLLRPLVEAYYDVQTSVAVGDAPREADLLLLLRTGAAPPFKGLWRLLTLWNVLEYKGPTVSARLEDIDLLVELGLGIDRRRNQDQDRQGLDRVAREQVSFWYLVSGIGPRFLAQARKLLGEVSEADDGVWRATALGHPVFLVNVRKVPLQKDTIPLHLLGATKPENARQVALEVVGDASLWHNYGGVLARFFPYLYDEINAMAKSKKYGPNLDWEPFFEVIDIKHLCRTLGVERFLDAVGKKEVIKKALKGMPAEELMELLSPEQRKLLQKKQEK